MNLTFRGKKLNLHGISRFVAKIGMYGAFFLFGLLVMQTFVIYYSSNRGIQQISSMLPVYLIQKIDVRKFQTVYNAYKEKKERVLQIPKWITDPFE